MSEPGSMGQRSFVCESIIMMHILHDLPVLNEIHTCTHSSNMVICYFICLQ